MNNEYLWDKTGEDRELERLEEALAVFRYRETVKPAVVEIYSDSESWWRRPTSLKFAIASCAAIGLLTIVALRFSNETFQVPNTGDVVFVQQSMDAPDAESFTAPQRQPVENPERQYVPSSNRRRSISRTTAAFNRRPKMKYPAPAAELTAEEQFAYRQLMLALSITGSKLKIVQDTIDGTEDSNDDSKNQR